MSKNAGFIQKYRPELKMLLIFVSVLGGGQLVYRLIRDKIWSFWIGTMNTSVSAWLINLLTPDERVRVCGDILMSGGMSVQVKPGCDGIDALLLMAAALAAFPGRWKRKAWGVIGGLLVVYFFNILRTAGLYYTVKYRPDLFELMHMYVGQTFIIVVCLVYFVFWTSLQDKQRTADGRAS